MPTPRFYYISPIPRGEMSSWVSLYLEKFLSPDTTEDPAVDSFTRDGGAYSPAARPALPRAILRGANSASTPGYAQRFGTRGGITRLARTLSPYFTDH